MNGEVKPSAWMQEVEANPAILDIQGNKTLLVEHLTDDPPLSPEIAPEIRSLKDVFGYYKPKKQIDFENADGASVNEELHFSSLADFGKQGIVKQSPYLNELNQQCEDLQKFVQQLKSNKIFKSLLGNKEARASYLSSIQAMLNELEEADK